MTETNQYHYVIAGGGSAGCVLAARLSADPAIRVLLVEAGQDLPPGKEPAEIRSPAPIVIFHGTRYLWPDLWVKPFKRSRKTRFYEQARVLGGGSSVNAQVGNRGLPEDYDDWESKGATGWGWRDVLPYFRKLERDLDYGDDNSMHGSSGPIPVMRVLRPDWPIFSQKLARAAERTGLGDIVDQNAVFEDGYFAPAYTNEKGQRVGASMAYLTEEVRARDNLTVVTDSYVTKLHFEGRRAVGFDYEHKGKTARAMGDEVILSLGALHSPAMLMRSGIGPKAELQRFNIPAISVLDGVGKNLRDHPGSHLCAYVKPGARMPKGMVKSGHVAFRFTSKVAGAPKSDLYMHNGVSSAWHGVGQRVAYFYFWLNKSTAVGQVTLKDTDPKTRPHVEMNLLGEEFDAERLADGFRYVANLLDDPEMRDIIEPPFAVRFSPLIRFMSQVRPFNRLVMGWLGKALDGPAWLRRLLTRTVLTNAPSIKHLLKDPKALRDYLTSNVMSVSHVTCTCRMGDADDPQAVVDPAGRVYGVEGLRVIDASVMPSLPRANTNLATIMIAEKMADAILSARR